MNKNGVEENRRWRSVNFCWKPRFFTSFSVVVVVVVVEVVVVVVVVVVDDDDDDDDDEIDISQINAVHVLPAYYHTKNVNVIIKPKPILS